MPSASAPSSLRFHVDGDGIHLLPANADVRKAIGKEAGDSVKVRLQERDRYREQGSRRRGVALVRWARCLVLLRPVTCYLECRLADGLES